MLDRIAASARGRRPNAVERVRLWRSMRRRRRWLWLTLLLGGARRA
jgi:hypothetical protein